MVDSCRAASSGDSRLASRKAEEAALRRFQATGWMESMVGPLGLPPQPSEKDFVSCLRNGLVLCNVINKIQPGAVPKVIANQSPGISLEMQPLPAYQYFENVRNFLVAMEELKLPAFEACDLERDTVEAGSTAKIVDCILSMKSYQERKDYIGGNGSSWNSSRSPTIHPSIARIHSHMISSGIIESCRRLDPPISSGNDPILNKNPKIEDFVKMLTECMLSSKENIDQDLMNSFYNGTLDPVEVFTKILSTILQEQQLKSVIKDLLLVEDTVMGNSFTTEASKGCKHCFRKVNCCHCYLIEAQEKELRELKIMLSSTKEDVIVLHSQFQNGMRQLGAKVQELSAAALGYNLAMKENRNLYNMLQDLKGKIRVYCRIRPTFNNGVKCSVDFIGDDGSLIVMDPLKLQNDSRKVFHFNKVFGPTATQEEIYKDTEALVRSVMDGYNVCIFAYGQTGSGKTHTMCGPPSGSSKGIGINYMALNDLFKISCDRKDVVKYEVQVQMVEIYNEQVRDLLAEDTSTTKLEIRTSSTNGGFSLPDAHMHHVNSAADVLNLMKLGEKSRAVSSTATNQRSSRSHSILTVHVQGKETSGSSVHGCLHLVDLAGSERVDKSEVTGDRLKEAQYINRSLSCLGDVITALARKNSHIPYRNSKLTQLLQDSLGGNAKTLMVAHVSPEGDSYGETISTLKFAQRVSTIELGAACLNRESNEVCELKEQIESLKKVMVNKGGDKTENMHKQMAERTLPRPRRLSIDNSYVVQEKKTTNLNDKKVLKTPLVRPKPGAQQTPIWSRRLSLEGLKCGKEQQLQSSAPSRMFVEINAISPPQVVCSDSQKSTLGSGNCFVVSANAADEAFNSCSPNPCKSADQTQAQKLNGRARVVPLYQPKTPEPLRKLDEVVTPIGDSATNKSQLRSSSNNSSRKESQIRKSLKTIGKLINGSERRNYRSQQETPSPKHGRNDNKDEKSCITANARSQMTQSSTNIRTSGFLPSRRSSLGGNSTISGTSETRTPRTPPPNRPSPMVAKPWV